MHIALAEKKDDSRDEVRVDVDRLVMHIPPTPKRSVDRVGNGSIAVENIFVRFAAEPFRHIVEREKKWL